MNRDDLELVLAIRDEGSLSGAARQLGLEPPAITKRLAALEARLGLRLFERTTRRVHATAEGETVCRHGRELLTGFDTLGQALRERQSEPSGRLRLASSFGFGRLWLGPALAEFQARHPRLSCELTLTERLPDLVSEDCDGAVWLWSVRGGAGNQWTTRRLARNRRVLVAAPSYLQHHGEPQALDELAHHACLVVTENTGQRGHRHDLWALQRERDREPTRVSVRGPLQSNSGELVRDWCLAGHGIMLRSLWDVAPMIARGELRQLLPAWHMADADVHWLSPWQPSTPRRLRLLIDFLAERWRDPPWNRA
jgi:DNA-binding transcriptional LysR family regulator